MNKFFDKIGHFIRRIIDWFYFPIFHFIPREVFRYAATGGSNTLLDIILYYIFYTHFIQQAIIDLGFVAISRHIATFLLVFPITFTNGFLLNKYVTFSSSKLRGRVQLFRYLLSVCGSIFLNYILLKFFVEYCEIYAPLAKVFTTALVIIYSYLAQRYFTFKTGKSLLSSTKS